MANYCPHCGAQVEPTWKVCPNCGERLTIEPSPPISYEPSEPRPGQVSYPYPQPTPAAAPPYQIYPSRRGNKWGTYSLICGIIGCCVFGIILGPLALFFAYKGLKKDDNTTLSAIGLILGIIDVIGFFISFFLLLPDLMSLYY
ncbi:MAG: zinc-ribbon domain-containing protein [Promethearchaeota archaeon]